LSEPESRIAYHLILRVRPQISIWFHQHERAVDESGGDVAVERRFAALVGLPLRRLPREPGSAVGWENHRLPGTTAFVVELPGVAVRRRCRRLCPRRPRFGARREAALLKFVKRSSQPAAALKWGLRPMAAETSGSYLGRR